MMILIMPVDCADYDDAKIVSLTKKENWIVVEMDAGFVKKYNFYKKREDIDDFIDYLIVKSAQEDIEEFLDEGIEVLVAPLQEYIEDVIEAYKFRELHEL